MNESGGMVPSPCYGSYDLPQGGDCFLAKELDASKNYLNASALKMLLTVLKVSWLVGLLKKNNGMCGDGPKIGEENLFGIWDVLR